MTTNEILNQVRTLSPTEQLDLIQQLMLMVHPVETRQEEGEHWGQAIARLLDEVGPIELKYPDIEDPVEWVKHLRAERRNQRLGGSS